MKPLVCKCGVDLGIATLATKGLCPNCNRSIWLQVALQFQPKSEAIAYGLNRRLWNARIQCRACYCKYLTCHHHNAPCYTRCGVTLIIDGIPAWRAISPERRREWLEKVAIG